MKNWKHLGRRTVSLLLCLVMMFSMLQLTALADGEEVQPDTETSGSAGQDTDGGSDSNVTTTDNTISASEGAALIPSNAHTETSYPSSGTTQTDTTWSYEDESKKQTGEYGDKTTVSDNTPEGILNPDVEDGTYTKVESQDKQDVKVEVEGEQHRTDEREYDSQGRPIRDSFELNGQQTTTTTTTDTTKTTTTDTTKKTETTETNPGLEISKPEGEKKPVEGSEKTQTTEGALSDPTKTGPETDANKSYTNQENQGGNVTVTMDKDNTSVTVTDTTQRDAVLPNLNKIFEHVAGWEVKDENGNVVGTIDATGKVAAKDGTSYQAGFTKSGSTWTFTLNAQKTEDAVKTGESKPGEGDKSTVTSQQVGDLTDGKTTTAGEVKTQEGEFGEATRVPVYDEDGKVIGYTDTYSKDDVISRTDTNEWTEITEITEEEWEQITKYFNRTINVTLGDPRSVTGNLTIVPVQGSDGRLTLTVGGRPLTDQDGELKYSEADDITGEFMVGYKVGDTVKRDYTKLYAIKGDNGIIYGFCLEKGTHLDHTASDSHYQLVNLEDALSYGANGTSNAMSYITADDVKHLNYIAQHGYWGGGKEELDRFNEHVKGNFTEKQALSITQAAVWQYADPLNCTFGDQHQNNPDKSNPFYLGVNANGTIVTIDKSIREAALTAYNTLSKGTVNSADQTQIVTTSDVTKATVTVKEKVDTIDQLTAMVIEANKDQNNLEQGGALVNSDGRSEQYKVDASVTMAITPSRIGNDLMLYVYVGDTIVASARMSDGAKGAEGDGTIKMGGKDGAITYMVENLTIGEGVTIDFKIHGDQKLKEGVYLFQDNKYQNFGALVKEGSTRHVDFDVKMDFNVDEGKEEIADHQDSHQDKVTWTKEKVTTQKFTSETDHENTKTTKVTVTTTVTEKESSVETIQKDTVRWQDMGTQTYSYSTPGDDDDDDDDRRITESDDDTDIPETDVPRTEAPSEDTTPSEEELPEENVPLAEMPEEEEELPEDEVPLADVPATGDISMVWYAVMGLSAAGLFCLEKPRRREDGEDAGET